LIVAGDKQEASDNQAATSATIRKRLRTERIVTILRSLSAAAHPF
jgi:hypothetical protein